MIKLQKHRNNFYLHDSKTGDIIMTDLTDRQVIQFHGYKDKIIKNLKSKE